MFSFVLNFQMAIIHSKMVHFGKMRYFLTSTFFIDVKITSYAQFESFLSELCSFESLLPMYLLGVHKLPIYFWTFLSRFS